jgi:hypothetical protein
MRRVGSYVHRHQAQKPKEENVEYPTGATPSCDMRMQRNAGLRVYTTPAKEPGIELALN